MEILKIQSQVKYKILDMFKEKQEGYVITLESIYLALKETGAIWSKETAGISKEWEAYIRTIIQALISEMALTSKDRGEYIKGDLFKTIYPEVLLELYEIITYGYESGTLILSEDDINKMVELYECNDDFDTDDSEDTAEDFIDLSGNLV